MITIMTNTLLLQNLVLWQQMFLAAQTYLIRKPDFDLKLKGISDRVTKNMTKYLLVENELKNYKNLMLLF